MAQIRDTLQAQHMQQQQQKIQQQLLYHQQHLQHLSSSMIPSANGVLMNNTNRNSAYDRMNYHSPTHNVPQQLHSSHRNINNNTTKVLITAGNNNDSISSRNVENRDDPPSSNSATYLGDQALKLLAELKSSSC